MNFRRFWPFFGLLCAAGCAKSPTNSSGPSINAPNRLSVTLTTQQDINSQYFYAVALDDNPNDGAGPVALTGGPFRETGIRNGIVGGNFRLAIVYQNNRFRVYRRRDPSDRTTEVEITNSVFIGTPRASGRTISFVLDLDSTLPNGNFVFSHADLTTNGLPSTLDVNFATTNAILLDGDNRIKPVDSNDVSQVSRFFGFDISGSRPPTSPPNDEPAGDLNPGYDPNQFSGAQAVNFAQIDVVAFTLEVTRG